MGKEKFIINAEQRLNEKELDLNIPDDIIQKWQNIVDIMARQIGVPSGLIMRIVDSDIEVFVSSQTTDNPYHPGEREYLYGSGLYCETVIKTKGKLLVPNALSDEHWKNNPDIKLNMVSYLGFPLLFPDGTPFGTICVLDNKENPYSKTFIQLIQNFKEIIESHLELLYNNNILKVKSRRLAEYISEMQTLQKHSR
jgi:GAF domain-containing protein